MSAWSDLAIDNYSAASELFARQRWRSSISRAYYAVFARCLDALINHGQQMPIRGNPTHTTLQTMVQHNLSKVSPVRRQVICGMVVSLYRLRVMVDYGSKVKIESHDARTAASLMISIFRELRGL